MKNGLVVADSGPIFSLAVINKLEILDLLFDEVKIANAVWEEISENPNKPHHQLICNYFQSKVMQINSYNELTFIMDYGESESVILYREINADFLLLDDKKARTIAENFGIKCVGTIGLLSIAKDKGFIACLKPLFESFLRNNRFYSFELLNSILIKKGETTITK